MDASTDANSPILTALLQGNGLYSVQNNKDSSNQGNDTEPTNISGNQEHVLSILESIDPSKTKAIIVYDSDTESDVDNSYQLFVDLDSQHKSLSADNDTLGKMIARTPTTIQENNKNVDKSSSLSNVGAVMSTLSTSVDSVKIVKRANSLKSKIIKQKMQKHIDPKLVMKVLIPLVKLDDQPIWKKIHNGTVRLGKLAYHSRNNIRKLSKMEMMQTVMDSKRWVVILERLPLHILERYAGGGHARRAGPVRLPDIEQVRRENGRMLTAQVKPLAAASRASGRVPQPAISFVTKGLCNGARVLTLVPAAPHATDNTDGATAGPPAASEPKIETPITSTATDAVQALPGNQVVATDVIKRVEAQTDEAIELSDNEESLTTEQKSNAPPITHADDSPYEDFNTSYKNFVQHIDLNRDLIENPKRKRQINEVEAEAALKQIEKLKKKKRSHSDLVPKVSAVNIQKAKTANVAAKRIVHPKPGLFNTIVRLAKEDTQLTAVSQVQKPSMPIEAQSLSREAPSEQYMSAEVAPASDIVDLTDNETVVDLEDALKPTIIPKTFSARYRRNTVASPHTFTITKIVPTPPQPSLTQVAPRNDSSHEQNRSFVGQIVNRNGVPVVINNKTQMINQNIHGNVPTANNINVLNNTTMEVQNQSQIMTIPIAQNRNVVLQGYPPQNMGQPMVQFHQNIVVNQQNSDESLQQNVGLQNVIFTQPNYVPLRPNVMRAEHNSLPQIIIESDMLNQISNENIEVQRQQTFRTDLLNLSTGSYLILSPNLDQPNTINLIRHNAVSNVIPALMMEQQITNEKPMEMMPQISDVRSLAPNEQFNTAKDDSQKTTIAEEMVIDEKGVAATETDANEGVQAASFVPAPMNPLELYASMPKNARDILASASALVLARVPRNIKLWTLDTGYLVFTDSVLSLRDWSMFALTPRSVCELIRGEHELPTVVVGKCRPVRTNSAKRYVLVVSDDINPTPDPSGGPPAASSLVPSQERPRIKVKAFASLDNFNNRTRDNEVQNNCSNNTYSIRDEDRVNYLYEYNTNSLNYKDRNTLNPNKIGDVGGMDGTICKEDANIVINVNTDVINGDTDKVNSLNTDVLGNASTDSVNKENKDAVSSEITDTVVASDPSNSSKMDCEPSNMNISHSDTKIASSDSSETDSGTTKSNYKENMACNSSVSCNSVNSVSVKSDIMKNINNSNDLGVNISHTEVKNNTIKDLNTIDANESNSSSMDEDSSKSQCSNNININNHYNTDHSYSKGPEVVKINLNSEQTKNTDDDSVTKVNGLNEEASSTQTNTAIIDVDNKLDVNNSNKLIKSVDSPTVEVSSEVEPSESPSVKVNSDNKTGRKRQYSNYLVVSDRQRNYFRLSQHQNVYARMLSCVWSAELGFRHALRGVALLLYSAADARLVQVRACRQQRRVHCALRASARGCRMCSSGDWRHLQTLQLVAECFNELDSERPEWRSVV